VRTHRTRLVGIAAALLLVTAACSDSVEDEGPVGAGGNGDPESRTTRGVTDDTITVGGLAYDLYFGDSAAGVEARLKEANDAGGVHGRTIEFLGTENDENDAGTGQGIAQRLVEQEEVFALLPVMSGAFGASDYIVDNNIPMFGWGTNAAFCDNEVAFGVTGCVTNPSLRTGSNALGTTLEAFFDGDTDKSIAFIGEDNDSGRGGIALLEASVADKGFDVVMAEASLPAPPDPLGDASPFVSRLITSDDGEAPDMIYLIATLSGTNLAAAIKATGYEGMIITPSYSPLLLGQPGYQGNYINTQVGMDPETPANAAMLESVAEIDPDLQLNLALAVGYWSADFFVKALEETGEDLTVENLLATLNSGDFTYEVPDVVGLSEWPEKHSASVPCSALTLVEDGEFNPIVPLECGENITVNG
jgi:ABC-type branched-subunit amino acid transport system substrate-binding protein